MSVNFRKYILTVAHTCLSHLYVHAEMYARSKIHSAFSPGGKANTREPSLAPLDLSACATIGNLYMPSGI